MQPTFFDKFSNIAAAAVLFYFSIPNLLGPQENMPDFQQYEGVLGITMDTFRIGIGVSQIILAVLLLMVTFRDNGLMTKFVYLFLLLTMLGVLVMEFFVRPSPAALPLIAALVLIALSLWRIKTAV